MKHIIKAATLFSLITLLAAPGRAQTTPSMESISYALGILFAKNLQDQGLNEISTDDMAKGLAEQMAASASMTPEQANAMVGEFFQAKKEAAGAAAKAEEAERLYINGVLRLSRVVPLAVYIFSRSPRSAPNGRRDAERLSCCTLFSVEDDQSTAAGGRASPTCSTAHARAAPFLNVRSPRTCRSAAAALCILRGHEKKPAAIVVCMCCDCCVVGANVRVGCVQMVNCARVSGMAAPFSRHL